MNLSIVLMDCNSNRVDRISLQLYEVTQYGILRLWKDIEALIKDAAQEARPKNTSDDVSYER